MSQAHLTHDDTRSRVKALFVIVNHGVDKVHHGLGCTKHALYLVEPLVALIEIVAYLMPTAVVLHAEILDVFPVAREP